MLVQGSFGKEFGFEEITYDELMSEANAHQAIAFNRVDRTDVRLDKITKTVESGFVTYSLVLSSGKNTKRKLSRVARAFVNYNFSSCNHYSVEFDWSNTDTNTCSVILTIEYLV